METINRAIANPSVVLREEFDDWALLFDPDTGEVYGLNPIGVFIWKRLDGRHTVEDIYNELISQFDRVPEKSIDHINNFVSDLTKRGLAGQEV
ncbi:conserved hypothetical protein [Methanocella paludicola SANAE]|uniref:Coenzyme PQQ synthesis protein D n=1 Tax=Methanocella paludicola (strain DSM 17711 / JCM 13418 / NBRC 101707 / SANAE) TaxID=304371 RepID=D1YWY6_METPS|nr:SynChlorMet cassette protein ScmD [Methanocella paludicola]BAI60958.1 conserved hypothetical protein [Methanocella paludicola SANAE]